MRFSFQLKTLFKIRLLNEILSKLKVIEINYTIEQVKMELDELYDIELKLGN